MWIKPLKIMTLTQYWEDEFVIYKVAATESQTGWGWKGPLEIIWSKTTAEAGSEDARDFVSDETIQPACKNLQD